MYKVVQLAHPGKEWPGYSQAKKQYIKSKKGIIWNKQYEAGIREWNNLDSHKRKFIFSKNSTYIDSKGKLNTGDITFWGEWEPHSTFELISKDSKDFYGSRMMHFPYFNRSYDGPKKHTTDPFVFGNNFWYTHCKQSTKQPAQSLKKLQADSIIIMGSERSKDKTFLVDTIFVIKRRYSQSEIRDKINSLPKLLLQTNLIMHDDHDLIRSSKYSDFGFYEGKNNQEGNMFSFVPAKLFCKKDVAHERLVINTYDKFFNLQRAGAGSVNKVVMQSRSFSEVKQYWDKLVHESFNQGFVLATNIPMPQQFSSNPAL